MWIYGTISPSLLDTVLKSRCTARELWITIENMFPDNKEARAIQLENELRSFTIGDLSMHDYCQKLKSLSDLLANVDSPVSERAMVMHMLNGLSEKFDNIHNVIQHKSPFPSFAAARSMLILKEERLNKPSKPATPAPLDHSTPHLLYTSTSPTAPSPDPDTANRSYNQQPYPSSLNHGHQNRGRGRGRNNNYRGRGRHNTSWRPQHSSYFPAPPQQQQWHPQSWAPNPQHCRSSPMAYHVSTALPSKANILGPYHPTVPTGPQMPTIIPSNISQAFGTMTLQNPQDSNWYMDTGATGHITSEPGLEHPKTSTPM
ncbi:PREDICTED: developmental and secondary metabolism regulator VEA1-like [Camelina sativa]|uniref:Developmental and secondary metabolism regulator VEA1-like n=1 Tax=Camelina sativa TaxID=90675 RepID=A0ABM0URS8_CAMSA|nr:PREDICTED: developmental and secondary metabolism regulator VEA1-like [Camelina sativa]